MIYCPECGEEIFEDSKFCQNCGQDIPDTADSKQKSRKASSITDEDYSTFIGKGADKYLLKFKKYKSKNIEKFSFTWHWPAFFIPFMWMLYRKLFLWALFVFILNFFGFIILAWFFEFYERSALLVGILISIFIKIIFGLTGNFIYYKHIKNKVILLKRIQTFPDQQKFDLFPSINNAPSLLIAAIVVTTIIGFLAAIWLPSFTGYLKNAPDSAAKLALKTLARAQENYYATNDTFTATRGNLNRIGWTVESNITVSLIGANLTSWSGTASHNSSTRTFTYDSAAGGLQ